MKVCALIPAFNEAGHIEEVVRGAAKHTQHVLVIDDGSTDGTADIAQAAGAACLRCEVNSGKASALRAGIDFAKHQDFTHVLFMDGDGQHAPEDIPALLNTARSTGADLVMGTRSFAVEQMPRARYYSNTIGSKVASWLVGREIKDSQCGFRLVRLEKLRQLKLRARKYELEMEILIKLAMAGCSMVSVPVRTVYDSGQARSKMKPVRDTVRICFWSLGFRFLGL